MMEELYLRTLLLGGREFEWLAVIALFVVGGFYFLVPAVGYSSRGRGLLIAAMSLLLLKLFFAFVRLGFWQYEMYDRYANQASGAGRIGGGGGGGGTGPGAANAVSANVVIQIFLPVLEAGIFLLAMLLFCIGLMTLTRAARNRLDISRHGEDL